MLVLDDVHWADAASVDLLGTLLRRPPAAAVLVAHGRPAAAAGRAARRRARARASRRPRDPARARRAGRDEAAELLGDDLAAALADALYAESGGNPFYLEQLARSVRRGRRRRPRRGRSPGRRRRARGGGRRPDRGARAAGRAARRLLEGAAVAGDPFEPELAAAAAASTRRPRCRRSTCCSRCGLVRRTDVPRRFRFRHPLIRRAVYDRARRLACSARTSAAREALAERGASAAARAHHVEHAARHGDGAAVALLARPGEARARARRAPRAGSAPRCGCSPETRPPRSGSALLMARAAALAASGELEREPADLLDASSCCPTRGRLRVAADRRVRGRRAPPRRHAQARARLAGRSSGSPTGGPRRWR